MGEIIGVHDAKRHLSRLLDEVRAGKEFVLAKAGKPYARLMPPAAAPARRQRGRLAGRVGAEFFDALPPAELAGWG